jgi:hypothetical protein
MRLRSRAVQIGGRNWFLVELVHIRGHFEGGVPPHVFERREIFFGRSFWEARYGVFENPAIVFVYRDLLPQPVR